MKHIITFLTAVAFAITATAADNQKSILDGISVSPVGAYKQEGFTHGPGQWGAGVDLGLPINKFVSIHVRNLAFEGPGQSSHGVKTGKGFDIVTTGQEPWGGSVVDETSLYARADFVSFAGEKFRLFGTGGGSRHWESEEWSFGIGVGAEYRFTKNIAASVSREIRAYTKGTKDWLSVAALTWTF